MGSCQWADGIQVGILRTRLVSLSSTFSYLSWKDQVAFSIARILRVGCSPWIPFFLSLSEWWSGVHETGLAQRTTRIQHPEIGKGTTRVSRLSTRWAMDGHMEKKRSAIHWTRMVSSKRWRLRLLPMPMFRGDIPSTWTLVMIRIPPKLLGPSQIIISGRFWATLILTMFHWASKSATRLSGKPPVSTLKN
mmetsp:Transcript_5771/g.13610  ORF Transcript_5771/g.13610 Transcript_5771/m.13610 type:complete len:191 (+) Transcript_5771:1215-1787(+)